MFRFIRLGRAGLIGGVVASALFSASAGAQYKWVAPDGTVTYGDRPPIAEVKANKVGGVNNAGGGANANLPYALRAPTDKYPVALYTTTDCRPCDQMRSHLSKRGVPFSEKLIKSQADVQVMEKLGFSDPSFPLMTVGKQKQTGFEPGAIDSLLDNAGYPRTSLLPAGYRNGGNDAASAKSDAARGDRAKADGGKAGDSANGDGAKPGDQAKNDANGADAAKPGETPRQAARRRHQEAAAAVQSSAASSTPSDKNPNGLRF